MFSVIVSSFIGAFAGGLLSYAALGLYEELKWK